MTTHWPALPLDAWRPTRDTLHRYAQIVGKVQLALTPRVNHFWNVTLRVTARGLATTALHYGDVAFDIELDLVEHRLIVRTSDGRTESCELRPLAVADFHRQLLGMLESLGISVHISDHPVEIATEAIPFSQDRVHAAYDREAAERFFTTLSGASELLEEFRAHFTGKCSGVGFYWGTFDLAVARYSGRGVEVVPPGAIEREAYSHEVSEVGFWPGDAHFHEPAIPSRSTIRCRKRSRAPPCSRARRTGRSRTIASCSRTRRVASTTWRRRRWRSSRVRTTLVPRWPAGTGRARGEPRRDDHVWSPNRRSITCPRHTTSCPRPIMAARSASRSEWNGCTCACA